MAKPNVRAVAVLFTLAMTGVSVTSDSARRAAVVWIGYIGNRPAEQDESYTAFRDSYERLAANGAASPVRFRHHHVAIGPEARMSQGVAEAMASAPTVMIAPTAWLAVAASAWASRRTAVVFVSRVNPMKIGIADSLAASGRPVTGVSLDDAVHDKRIELLRDAKPSIRHVGVLCEASWLKGSGDRTFATASRHLGLTITVHLAERRDEIDTAIAQGLQAGVDAWYVPYSFISYTDEAKIIDQLNRIGQPAIFASPRSVSNGAPMSAWQDGSFVNDALARLTWRVVYGEDPAKIAIERPKRFLLEVRGDANAAGLRVDPSVIRRADIVR